MNGYFKNLQHQVLYKWVSRLNPASLKSTLMGWWAVQSVFQLFGALPAYLLLSSGICAQFSASNWMFTLIFYFLRCLFLISVIILEPNCIKGSTLAVLIYGVCPLCVFIQTESHSKGIVVCSRGYQRSWSWTPGELNGWRLRFPSLFSNYTLLTHFVPVPWQSTCSQQKYLIIMGPFFVTLYFENFCNCVHVYLYRMEWFKPGDNIVTVLKIWLVSLITQ